MFNSNLFKEIVSQLLKNQINKIDAIDGLISLIEKTDNQSLRIQSMELLNQIEPKSIKLFQLFENLLISDEDELIRKQAVKLLLQNYSEDSYNTLKWSLLNDKSSKVLKVIKNRVVNSHQPIFESLSSVLNERLKIIADLYKLGVRELAILLDLEVNVNGNNYYFYTNNSGYIIDENFTCFIENSHIKELSLSLQREIPLGVYTLRKLETLNLSFNYISFLPDNITKLVNLKHLDLSSNEFSEVPEILLDLKNIEYIDLKNNKLEGNLTLIKEKFAQNQITIKF